MIKSNKFLLIRYDSVIECLPDNNRYNIGHFMFNVDNFEKPKTQLILLIKENKTKTCVYTINEGSGATVPNPVYLILGSEVLYSLCPSLVVSLTRKSEI